MGNRWEIIEYSLWGMDMAMEIEYVVNEEEQISELLRQGEIIQIEQRMKTLRAWTASLVILKCLLRVFRTEVENEEHDSIFDYSVDLDMLKKHFVKIKLLLRRLDFDLTWDEQMEFYDYCTQTKVSKYLVASIVLNNMVYKEKVCARLIQIYSEKEGDHSEKAQYFEGVLRDLKERKNG